MQVVFFVILILQYNLSNINSITIYIVKLLPQQINLTVSKSEWKYKNFKILLKVGEDEILSGNQGKVMKF